jgi:hypothetical protein
MKNREASRYKQKLDDLFLKIASVGDDLEMRSHWSKYLCIRVSGFLEVSIRSIYTEYCKNKSAPFVANYIEKKLASFQNPTMQKILDLAGSFNPQWADELKAFSESGIGEIKDSIVSIVATRNQIAHGENVNITFTKISNYYKNSVLLVEFLEEQCLR